MTKSAIEELEELVHGHMELNVPMHTLTTIRTGGPADLLIHPSDRTDLTNVMQFLHGRSIEVRAIGNASSVIVRDGGIRGAVVKLGTGFSSIEPAPDWSGNPQVRVDAGVQMADLTEWTIKNGFGGLEFLSGIPGTLGGAIFSNSIGWGKTMGEMVASVEVMDTLGNILQVQHDDIGFSDRRTNLPPEFIILSATLTGEPRSPEQVEMMSRNFASRRHTNYPHGGECVGMVFRNSGGQTPEKLIEACGLKGVRVGDAEVSRLHANFIINLGNAESGNVISLIGMIQERVWVKYKIKLETACTVLGNWQKSKVRIKE